MGFAVKGDYFETCSCDVSCQCIWLGPATQDTCDVLFAWHVTEGQKDGVDLSGLNAVMAVHTSKRMTDGGWKVALYLDDRATSEQSEALGAVFSGGAGGHLAAVAPLVGEVVGVAPASISFDRSGTALKATVGDVLSMGGRGDRRRGRVEPPGHLQSLAGGRPAGPHAGEGRRRPLPRALGRGVLRHQQLRHRLRLRGLTTGADGPRGPPQTRRAVALVDRAVSVRRVRLDRDDRAGARHGRRPGDDGAVVVHVPRHLGRDDGGDDVPVGGADGDDLDPLGRCQADPRGAVRWYRGVPRWLPDRVGRVRCRRLSGVAGRAARWTGAHGGEVGRWRHLPGRGDLPADPVEERVLAALSIPAGILFHYASYHGPLVTSVSGCITARTAWGAVGA